MAAFIQKYDDTATTKTHGLVDGTFMDVILPTVPLDTTGNLLRTGLYALGAWVIRGKKETGNFGL